MLQVYTTRVKNQNEPHFMHLYWPEVKHTNLIFIRYMWSTLKQP